MIEVCVLPERRRGRARGAEEFRILGVGDLRRAGREGVDPDAMDGAFAVLAGVGAHQEPGGWDRDQSWFECGAGCGFRLRCGERHGGCRVCRTGLKFTSDGWGGWRWRRRSYGFRRRFTGEKRAWWRRSCRRWT